MNLSDYAVDDRPELGAISGFERRKLPGDGVAIDALVGGSGPALLLLHGYPQTRMAWAAVAARLSSRFTLVIPDLRGYGRSDKPRDDTEHRTYSKRVMARDQIASMSALGFKRFCVAGHDRGGRVAYRLALDFPDAVERVAVLDIVPTAEVFAATAASAMSLFHWSFLAQPYPLPERVLAHTCEFFLRHLFRRWTAPEFQFHPTAMRDYLASGTVPAAIHAACADYRAGWAVDRLNDLTDKGRRRVAQPLLVLWGEHGAATSPSPSPLEVWKDWADQCSGRAVPSGHFLPEEAPEDVAEEFSTFFLGRPLNAAPDRLVPD